MIFAWNIKKLTVLFKKTLERRSEMKKFLFLFLSTLFLCGAYDAYAVSTAESILQLNIQTPIVEGEVNLSVSYEGYLVRAGSADDNDSAGSSELDAFDGKTYVEREHETANETARAAANASYDGASIDLYHSAFAKADGIITTWAAGEGTSLIQFQYNAIGTGEIIFNANYLFDQSITTTAIGDSGSIWYSILSLTLLSDEENDILDQEYHSPHLIIK